MIWSHGMTLTDRGASRPIPIYIYHDVNFPEERPSPASQTTHQHWIYPRPPKTTPRTNRNAVEWPDFECLNV